MRWALLDFQASHTGRSPTYEVRRTAAPANAATVNPLTLTWIAGQAIVDTGRARFVVSSDGTIATGRSRDETVARVDVVSGDGDLLHRRQGRIVVEREGPLRMVLLCTFAMSARTGKRRLDVFLRYHFFAGSANVRVQVTVRNPHRARHDGGHWELGDPGSWLIRDLSFILDLPAPVSAVRCSPERGHSPDDYPVPFTVYQESSGGERWNARTHINRDGRVPMQMRGYTITGADQRAVGLRATPVVQAVAGTTDVAVAHPLFWERFPKSITVADARLRVGLLPLEFPDVHELQGGEQITEDFVVALGRDDIGEEPLAWVRDPMQVVVPPEWYCAAEALPDLVPSSADRDDYRALVNAAVDGPDSFETKRETIDEYGWRNFGELYADHETVHHRGAELFVSHYNNQYDAAAGLAIHVFRSGSRQALKLFDELMRHVIDVDIYHTTEDRPAYNHGLFWHTAHHTNAGRATHRTYPTGSGASGGPSAEHNYNTGLMLHYFMTGDPGAREAAIELAHWVIDMDDGSLTPLRWLSRAPTGFASATGSFDYHGPGRGPGNGIIALLNAHRLTGERRFIDKAEELIRRCVHPGQDLEALNLLDTERRWYYTVFLQALGRYLGIKTERNELDESFEYASASLLHYARWMAANEYPYLEKPDRLEFPTETWAAQDMRKSEVFTYAAQYADAAERRRFEERAAFFFDYTVRSLSSMPTSRFTRPRVLMLTNGYRYAAAHRHGDDQNWAARTFMGSRRQRSFIPQRRLAMRRLIAIVVLVGAAATAWAGAVLLL